MTKRKAAAGAGLVVLAAGLLAGAFVFVGRWLQYEEAPVKSDAIVVLAGNPVRAIKAAELFNAGFAPDIWLSRPAREPWLKDLDRIGVVLPTEEELYFRVLDRFKVPRERVHYYSKDALSTAEEAVSLHEVFGDKPVNILIVSDRTHLRRAKAIFSHYLPKATFHMVAADQNPPKANWWTDKYLATQVLTETARTIFFDLGGRFFFRPHKA